jgi:hypothetical protein
MNAARATAEPIPADPSSDRAERRLRILQELAEIGMDLARAVRTRALAARADPAAAVDLGLSFSRIARAVRQTVALEARLDQDRQAAAAERAERRVRDAREHAYEHKARIRSLVERAIDAEASGEAAEDLLSDLDERLEDADDLAGFADRPVAEIVQHICRELDVTPPPALWDEAEWGLAGGGAKGPLHISSAPEAEPGTGRAETAWPDPTATPGRTRSP